MAQGFAAFGHVGEELASGGHYDTVAREVLATAVRRQPVADGTKVDLGELGAALIAIRS